MRRFRVALSFPGEHRTRVQRVAELLAAKLSQNCVLYDKWCAAEFNRPNLNIYLPELYRKESDLVVAFVCDPYRVKKWTGLEWRAFQALLMDQQFDRLMVFRLDDAEIPGLYEGDGYQDMQQMSDEEVAHAILSRVPPVAGPVKKTARLFTSKLPAVSPDLFGRGDEIDWLDKLWADPGTNVVQIVAAGGTGKTALVGNWWKLHKEDAGAVFGWSFYSQGSAQDRQTSSEPFFNEIVGWFQLNVRPDASVYTKASAVAEKLRQQKVLLLLDGCEPLQESDGSFRDKALQALLQELLAGHQGLAVCTTRVKMDLPEAEHRDLSNLTQECGAQYLEKLGVVGERNELIRASKEYGNHALALTLLGTYLKDFLDGAVMRRFEIPRGGLEGEEGRLYEHARRMIAAYEARFRGTREESVLKALGYFDRPAEPDALKLVLPPMTDIEYRRALKRLHEARLVLTPEPAKDLDCHPLIREHFAQDATVDGHAKLFEHYKAEPAKEQPDTLEEMQPLFHAVAHGCRAGRHVEIRRDIYRDRILRGKEFYLTSKLGAFGTDLSLVANFFEEPWTRPHPSFSPTERSWLIGQAGIALRAVGQLASAVAPMQAAAELARDAADWTNAAARYSNLAELHSTLGNLAEAVAAAGEAVEFADRSDDAFQRMSKRTTLADALHQSGDVDGARRLFEEAERIQIERQPEYPILYSVAGYRYCDLLLAQGETADALSRASRTLPWEEEENWLLSIGLDHLTLGHHDQAVDFLRRAGALEFLSLALLARATPADLAEAYRIATRSGMRLHLTDYHLISARQALAANDTAKAQEHHRQAADLIEKTGYHRRDAELESIASKCQT